MNTELTANQQRVYDAIPYATISRADLIRACGLKSNLLNGPLDGLRKRGMVEFVQGGYARTGTAPVVVEDMHTGAPIVINGGKSPAEMAREMREAPERRRANAGTALRAKVGGLPGTTQAVVAVINAADAPLTRPEIIKRGNLACKGGKSLGLAFRQIEEKCLALMSEEAGRMYYAARQ